jgi:hypothetical protein
MAVIFIDGFDKYGATSENDPSATTLVTQEWTSLTNASGGTFPGGSTFSIVNGLSATGYAIQINGGAAFGSMINRTLPANYSRLIGGVRVNSANVSALPVMIMFLDGVGSSTTQCAVVINTSGKIEFRSGGNSQNMPATVLATSTTSITSGVTHYLEWDITFHNTAGAYQVWLDGASVIGPTTSANTRGGTTNSYANVFSLCIGTGNSTNVAFDDVYLFDSTGTTNNAVLLSNPRIETRYPTSDSQTQWTNSGNVLIPVGITQTGVSTRTASTNAPGAGQLALMKITPNVTCNLQSVGLYPGATSAAAKFKAVLYADSTGSPGSLTATGTEVTGTTANTALTLPFASGQSLTASTSYWIGFITDTSVALNEYDASSNQGQKKANTYASGAPNPAGTMTTAQASWVIWGNATGATTNWESVATNPPSGSGAAGDNSSVQSSTVGNEDLYGFPALTTTPSNIYTVAVKAHIKRSDTGARTIDLRMKSNTNGTNTDSGGSSTGQTPGTSYGWLASYFDTDPDTSAAWTASGANNAKAGVKIAS